MGWWGWGWEGMGLGGEGAGRGWGWERIGGCWGCEGRGVRAWGGDRDVAQGLGREVREAAGADNDAAWPNGRNNSSNDASDGFIFGATCEPPSGTTCWADAFGYQGCSILG